MRRGRSWASLVVALSCSPRLTPRALDGGRDASERESVAFRHRHAAVAAGRRPDAAALACGWVSLADAERARAGGRGRANARPASASPSSSHPDLDEVPVSPDEAGVAVAVHALAAVAAAAAAVASSPPSLRAGVAATDGGLARDPGRRGGAL